MQERGVVDSDDSDDNNELGFLDGGLAHRSSLCGVIEG